MLTFHDRLIFILCNATAITGDWVYFKMPHSHRFWFHLTIYFGFGYIYLQS